MTWAMAAAIVGIGWTTCLVPAWFKWRYSVEVPEARPRPRIPLGDFLETIQADGLRLYRRQLKWDVGIVVVFGALLQGVTWGIWGAAFPEGSQMRPLVAAPLVYIFADLAEDFFYLAAIPRQGEGLGVRDPFDATLARFSTLLKFGSLVVVASLCLVGSAILILRGSA